MWPFATEVESTSNVNIDQHVTDLHFKADLALVLFAVIAIAVLLYKSYKKMKANMIRDAIAVNRTVSENH